MSLENLIHRMKFERNRKGYHLLTSKLMSSVLECGKILVLVKPFIMKHQYWDALKIIEGQETVDMEIEGLYYAIQAITLADKFQDMTLTQYDYKKLIADCNKLLQEERIEEAVLYYSLMVIANLKKDREVYNIRTGVKQPLLAWLDAIDWLGFVFEYEMKEFL